MPRPPRFSVDELLDIAAQLVAAHGPAAVTMSAVARAAGAPSGSMYHRFSTRAALCGALWLRAEEAFNSGVTASLSSTGPVQARVVGAARFAVRWCRDHPAHAQVLFAGADALARPEWPEDLRARHDELLHRLRSLLADLPVEPDRLNAALIDIPYAVVRRYLMAHQPIPADAESIVEDCAKALISPT